MFRTLATESPADRLSNPGLEPERADVIVGGMCVLVEIMRNFGFDECLVSEADILDGLAHEPARRGRRASRPVYDARPICRCPTEC